jgi:ribonuclease HI
VTPGGARPTLSPQASPGPLTYAHLETDASLNDRRTQLAEDGSTPRFAGGGVVLRNIAMRPVRHAAVPLGFVRTPTEAECLALLAGIRMARDLGASTIRARSDLLHLVEALNERGTLRSLQLGGVGEQLTAEIGSLRGFQILWTSSHHGRTRGDGVPSADFLARQAAGLETRSVRRRRRRL